MLKTLFSRTLHCVFLIIYSVLFECHGSISAYCISPSFGISIYADIRPKGKNVKPDYKLGVCQSVVSLQVYQSVIASCQSANCMSVSYWQVCSLQRQVASFEPVCAH